MPPVRAIFLHLGLSLCLTVGLALGLLSASESAPAEPWEIHVVFAFQPEPVARILAPVENAPALPDIQVYRDLVRLKFGSDEAHAYLSGLDLGSIVTGEVAFRAYTFSMMHPDRNLAAACERLAFRLLRQERHTHPRFEAIRLLRLHMLTSETVTLFDDLGPDTYRQISLETGLAAAARFLEINDVVMALQLYQSCAEVYTKLAPTLAEDPGPAIAAALEALEPRYPKLADEIAACLKIFRKSTD